MNSIRPTARRAALTGAAAAASFVLAATGGITAATAATPATTAVTVRAVANEHNQADVTFAQQMIPHHRQAVAMVQMVRSHSSSSEIKALAARIEKAQEAEIDTMTGWLKAWGEKVPQGVGGMQDMPGMGQDSDDDPTSMPGMMDDQQMMMLDHASGRAFDTMFLTMMIDHHEGAIDMAKRELRQGSYGPAKDLAADIVRTQSAEIAQMRAVLKTR
ncbi:DUF305 domain-containing protein [Streptomyces avidinii]|uniref:DUF305 domain-containing protein n=1 Tax=Streptomyces avidinii TaxID=1895 RepID=UPI0037935114